MSLVQVRLARDSLTTPWGFRLQGGKDLSQTLVVQRVFANTPSEGELHRGDDIVAINGRDTSNLTHKQAQDAISGGGGQIELLVSRPPPGRVHIKPLSPTKDTRAPTFPYLPTKAPQINIPIQRRSGPQSPSRIIPVAPQKPAPPPPAPRPAPRPAPGPTMEAGHMPRKVTMNKFGGGNVNYGYTPMSPPAGHAKPSYRPVAAPVSSYDHPDYAAQYQPHAMSQPVGPTAVAAGAPALAAAPAQLAGPAHPHFAPSQPGEEKLVVEEEYGGVNERRKQFIRPGDKPANVYYANDEYDYPTAPVSERRRYFGPRQSRNQAVKRSNKPLPSFGRPPPGSEQVTFGVDYAHPHPKPPQQQPISKPQRSRPPPVNRRDDDVDSGGRPWSDTLRPEGRSLKPWEIEAMEAERYQHGTVDEPYRPSQAAPALAPKPAGPQQRSVSPYGGQKSPSNQPKPSRNVAGGQGGQGPNVVHLQYNSPMGLYSNANVRDTYVGQTQGQTNAPSGQKPAAPGDRDWNNSYVYQMIHSGEQTTSSSYQQAPGQEPQGETVTTTRTAHETQYPGQAPQRTVTESVQRSGPGPLDYNASLGMSDF